MRTRCRFAKAARNGRSRVPDARQGCVRLAPSRAGGASPLYSRLQQRSRFFRPEELQSTSLSWRARENGVRQWIRDSRPNWRSSTGKGGMLATLKSPPSGAPRTPNATAIQTRFPIGAGIREYILHRPVTFRLLEQFSGSEDSHRLRWTHGPRHALWVKTSTLRW